MKYLIGILTVILLTLACGSRNQQDAHPTVNHEQLLLFEQRLTELAKIHQVPGLSVAVLSHQQMIYSKGIGFVDIAQEKPASDTTLYRIASLTKPIASSVMLGLVERSKLELDWKMQDYYPEYRETFSSIKDYLKANQRAWYFLIENYHFERDDITIRHHLTHTAEGIPGSNYQYNGFLYGQLGGVIEQISERGYQRILEEDIFQPLEMADTFTNPYDSMALLRLAPPLKLSESGQWMAGNAPNVSLNAGAGIMSTVVDLAKFDIAFDQHKIISQESQKLTFTPAIDPDGKILPYGLGWFISEFNHGQVEVIYHTGWWPSAYSGLYVKVPEKELTLILLSNSENLTAPFNSDLTNGRIEGSPFAQAFLEMFIR